MSSQSMRGKPCAAAWSAIGGVVAMLIVAGCATTRPPTDTNPLQPAPPPGTTRDRVTASDESEATKRARVRLELATAYFARKQYTTALDELKLALAADPNIPGGYNLRGLIYASLGDEQLADESFRHALQMNPQDADTLQNYGWYQCQRRQYAQAEGLFARALAVPQYRDSPRTLLTQGICQARAGQWELAEKTLARSYELDPSNPSTAVNLTEVLYRRSDFERARFYIRRVNGNPDIANAQTLWLAAKIEHKLGNAQGKREFGMQLQNRFPTSREAAAFEGGRFDE